MSVTRLTVLSPVERGIPELQVLPDGVILDESVDKLDPSGTKFPAEGAGQGQEGGGHTLHVDVGVVLERGVHQPHDQIELLVHEHGLVAHHVDPELLTQRQPRRFFASEILFSKKFQFLRTSSLRAELVTRWPVSPSSLWPRDTSLIL